MYCCFTQLRSVSQFQSDVALSKSCSAKFLSTNLLKSYQRLKPVCDMNPCVFCIIYVYQKLSQIESTDMVMIFSYCVPIYHENIEYGIQSFMPISVLSVPVVNALLKPCYKLTDHAWLIRNMYSFLFQK